MEVEKKRWQKKGGAGLMTKAMNVCACKEKIGKVVAKAMKESMEWKEKGGGRRKMEGYKDDDICGVGINVIPYFVFAANYCCLFICMNYCCLFICMNFSLVLFLWNSMLRSLVLGGQGAYAHWSRCESVWSNIGRLQTLQSLLNAESDRRTFIKRSESVHLYRGLMCK